MDAGSGSRRAFKAVSPWWGPGNRSGPHPMPYLLRKAGSEFERVCGTLTGGCREPHVGLPPEDESAAL